jgi:hypothetical protein
MLIEIDASAIEDAHGGRSASRDSIENLLHAHEAGRHVVYLDREQIRALKAIREPFSSRARGALENMRGQQHEIRGLRDRVRWLMKVGLGPRFPRTTVTQAEGSKSIIHADLHHFRDDERSSRSVMLGENLTDTALYVTMGKAFSLILAGARSFRSRSVSGAGTPPPRSSNSSSRTGGSCSQSSTATAGIPAVLSGAPRPSCRPSRTPRFNMFTCSTSGSPRA